MQEVEDSSEEVCNEEGTPVSRTIGRSIHLGEETPVSRTIGRSTLQEDAAIRVDEIPDLEQISAEIEAKVIKPAAETQNTIRISANQLDNQNNGVKAGFKRSNQQ